MNRPRSEVHHSTGRYLDSRLADELPHYGSYFFNGETGNGRQLTPRQLNKFDRVPGIKLLYRHGPVAIYDMKELGIPELRSGWFEPTPEVRLTTQLAVGLAVGVLLGIVVRSPVGRRAKRQWIVSCREWGPSLTVAVVLAGTCLISIMLLLGGVWLTPLTVLTGVGVVVLTNFEATVSLLRRAAGRVSSSGVRSAALVAVPLLLIIAVAIWDAAMEIDVRVNRILNDPAAVHISPNSPDE